MPFRAFCSLAAGACLVLAGVSEGRLAGLPRSSAQQQSEGPAIRRDANLVLVNASVTDSSGKPITNLSQSNFRVFDDNAEQEIVRFSTADIPASIGIILDTSGSMKDKFAESRMALAQFLQTANPQDEFFLADFNDNAHLDRRFTQDIDAIEDEMAKLVPSGRTALYDAIDLGLNQMKEAENKRRALLIISDGGDNQSLYNKKEIVRFLKESDAQLYAIGLYGSAFSCPSPEECSGPSLLRELCRTTGGQDFPVPHTRNLSTIAIKLSALIRSQYLIAYAPKDSARDAKWHKIKVSLRPPKGLPALTVHARSGYFDTPTPD